MSRGKCWKQRVKMQRICRRRLPKGLFPSSLFSEQHIKAPAAGKAGTAGFAGRQVRRSHSGKHVRVKK
ncbi:hypothetical protein OIU76_022294, partial [Salix suchowensis]